MAKTIEVIVSPKGEVTIKTAGYIGRECQAASRFLEEALGEVANERKTAEYWQEAQQHQQIKQ